jgi:RNA polymerase sigma factor (sigma-70 family)
VSSGVTRGVREVLAAGSVRDVAQPAALEALYRDAYSSMVRLAHLLTGSNEVAEDLVQDCFARLQRRIGGLDNAGAYLRVSVVNACRSWHRRRARERDHLNRLVVTEAVSPETREMFDAIDSLPEAQRVAIVLKFYERCTDEEIAELLACPVGTVKSHVHRALTALRRVIER